MARQRGFPLRRPAGSGRQTAWGFGPGGVTATTFTATSKAIIGDGLGLTAGTGKATVVRLRGELMAFLNSATAQVDGFACAFGIGLVTKIAFAAGVASIPGPLTEMDWDGWMFHTLFQNIASGPIAAGTSQDQDAMLSTTASVRLEVDSKAMRKMDEEVILVSVCEVVELGTASMSLFFDSRLLLKLG